MISKIPYYIFMWAELPSELIKFSSQSFLKKGDFVSYECSRIVEIAAFGLLANPKAVGRGLVGGMMSSIAGTILYSVVINLFKITPDNKAFEFDLADVRQLTFTAPIMEEIGRICVLKTATWCTDKVLKLSNHFFQNGEYTFSKIKINAQAIHILGIQITAQKIGLVISSVLFILAHNNLSPIEKLSIVPASFIFGQLAISNGVISSITAHMTHNTVNTILRSLA